MNAERRLKLRMKANTLIAQDRAEACNGRDPWPLVWFNHQVEQAYKDMARLMKEGLERLDRMGI